MATFSGLSITKAGSYQIQATSGKSAISDHQDVYRERRPGRTSLRFEQQPSNTIAGTTMGPVTVQVEDASGNPVTTDDSTVTVTLSNGTFADGSKTETAMAFDGIATFSSLIVDAAGDFTLAATDRVADRGNQQSLHHQPGECQLLCGN